MTSLTRVALACRQADVWLRFGRPMWEDMPDAHLRHVYFPPGAVFARVERVSSRGRVQMRLTVLRAAGPGERGQILAGVSPGAQVLLDATTPAQVRQVLELIETIEAQRIPPEDVSEDYWRDLHTCLGRGEELPLYSAAEHRAVRGTRP